MLEDKARQHDQQVVDKYHDPTADYVMSTRDYVLRPAANNITGDLIITLPPVAEAKGRFYSILPRDADIVNFITITDQNDSECWLEDIILRAPCQSVLLYSDGLFWHAMGLAARPGLTTTIAPATIAPATVAPTTLATSVAPTSLGTTVGPGTGQGTLAPTSEAPTSKGGTTLNGTTLGGTTLDGTTLAPASTLTSLAPTSVA